MTDSRDQQVWWDSVSDEQREAYEDEQARRQAEREVKARLEYLRRELRAERISWGELAELQALAGHIEAGDVELREAAGVPEYEPFETWLAPSSGLFELRMTLRQAQGASHPEPCDDDVAALATVPEIAAQLAAIPADALRRELREYGAWDDFQLVSHEDNLERVLWIAAADIAEQARVTS